MKLQLWDMDAAAYTQHALHRVERSWPESNCYVDLWVEVLHTAGAEPLAALPCALAIDVEGDQWTFLKIPLADLAALYGVDVFELNVWRSLPAHLCDQLARGRLAIVEVDAFYLPDTAGTSYRREHVKTSIGVQALDPERRRLGYFHNAGYYELGDEDFAGLFRLEGHLTGPEYLAPYVEVAKLGHRPMCSGGALVEASRTLLCGYLARLPHSNPFRQYATRFPADLEWLVTKTPSSFHNYAFATLRQCGSAFELAGAYLRWLEAHGEYGLAGAADACGRIATTAKTLQFKTARAVNTQKPLDAAAMLETMASAWDETMNTLTSRYRL